jgi:hypothetical protein
MRRAIGLLMLWSVLLGVGLSRGAGAQGALASLDEDPVTAVTVEGLTAADTQAALRLLAIPLEEPLDADALRAAQARLAKQHPDWVVGGHTLEPNIEGGQHLRLAVCYRQPAVETTVSPAGALSIRIGADVLLKDALPELYFFDRLVEGKAERPDYHWMTRGQRAYEAATRTLCLTHEWGRYQVTYRPEAGRLALVVQVTNTTATPLTNVNVLLTPPVAFPETPEGYGWAQGWGAMIPRGDVPAVAMADYGRGAVAVLLPGMPEGVTAGFVGSKRLLIAFSAIPAGASREATVTLRLGPGRATGTSGHALVRDLYEVFVATHPWSGPRWPDRRPIAALHPSSSELGAGTRGATRNPRGWFFENQDKEFEVETPPGRARFREYMFTYARNAVKICQGMQAQGIICWSLEGQEYPHTISYVGTPDLLPELAPEMDAIADEWFKLFTNAGLRVGITVRPEELTRHPQYDATAPPNQTPFKYYQRVQRTPDGRDDTAAILATLDRKITYANKRWGCTLFYVDSNVFTEFAPDPKTGKLTCTRFEVMPQTIFAELARRHPDCLIIPEHETLLYWTHSAPLIEGATSSQVKALWPEAFSVNLMQHFNPKSAKSLAATETAVRQGDILIVQGGWNDPNNAVIRQIYERCRR